MRTTKGSESLRLFCPALAAFTLIPFFANGTHFEYDFPALLLTTTALCFLSARKWVGYYFIFLLACINKETSILITMVCVFSLAGKKSNRLITHTLAQIALFIAIRGTLAFLFRDNPGGLVEHRFLANIVYLLGWRSLSGGASLILVSALVLAHFKQKPPFLRTASVMFWPLLILYMGYWGFRRDSCVL